MSATDFSDNPLINPPALPHGAPAFDIIKTEHFMPAIDWALEKARAEIDAIKNNADLPTFENTIEAMENAGEDLSRVQSIFSTIAGNKADDEIRTLEETIDQKMSAYHSDISFDDVLFSRIEAVYNARASLNLDPEQSQLLEDSYKGFVRSGALLDPASKDRLREINDKLSALTTKYSQNSVKAADAYERLVEDESELAGVPERAKKIYSQLAEEAGHPGKWMLRMSPYPSEVMSHCTNRALREEIYRASYNGTGPGPYDNSGVIMEIVALRNEAAKIKGYDTYAAYVLEERMAQTPQAVTDFLWKNQSVYKPAADAERQEIKDFALQKDGLTDLKPWDVTYYSRMLKEEKFSINTEALRPYFDLEKVLDGLRQHAEKLFNIELREETTGKYPVYDPEVRTYEIYDKKSGELMALFYADYYVRPGAKQEGAWMNAIRSKDGKNIPIIHNCCNFTKPTADQPTQLSLREVQTVFHEFGHGLHGALAEGKYASLNGVNVKWDWVELPSQLQENWVQQKEVLDTFARHYQTGELLPAEMIQKIHDMSNFQAGMTGLRQTFLGLLDMTWHTTDPASIASVTALEDSVMAATGLPARLAGVGLMSTDFGHIFSGGYAAGYYSYKWAEVLEADVFEAFKRNGLYDRDTADRLRATIYSQGGKVEPMDLFVSMMGRAPDQSALFRREGVLPPDSGSAAPAPAAPSAPAP